MTQIAVLLTEMLKQADICLNKNNLLLQKHTFIQQSFKLPIHRPNTRRYTQIISITRVREISLWNKLTLIRIYPLSRIRE